ncbi:MAG TPA: sensor histidine kinase [Acidimicrobiia bacterium]|nr:sensor histidine kinase [Acidimicrobiia bacterium]
MEAGSWGRSRLWLVSAAVLVAVSLAGAASMLTRSQDQSRADLEDRYALRASLASRFVDSYLDELARREKDLAALYLKDGTLDEQEFTTIVQALDLRVAVFLDGAGKVLHVWPPKPSQIGTEIASRYEHLTNAEQGRTAVSDVVASAAEGIPVVALAVPLRTGTQHFVFSGGFSTKDTPIATYLANATSLKDAHISIVDGSGEIVAAQGLDPNRSLRQQLPTLDTALTRDERGSYKAQGEQHFYSRIAVDNTDWQVVISAPHRVLYKPVTGLAQWVPWILLGILSIAAAFALVLLQRLAREKRELKRTNRELAAKTAQVEVLLGSQREFFNRGSHELRTPLTSVLGYIEELQDDPTLAMTTEQHGFLDIAYSNAQRLQMLVNDLLTIDQSDGGQMAYQPAPTKVVDLIAPEIASFRTLCERKNLALVVDLEAVATLPDLYVDAERTGQIITNLLSNALKYTPAGGQVSMRFRVDAQTLVIDVADTGLGIAPDELDRVFDRFFRSESPEKRAILGTGLGLPIARAMAEAQGGTLTVASELNSGSTFTLTLPLTNAPVRA